MGGKKGKKKRRGREGEKERRRGGGREREEERDRRKTGVAGGKGRKGKRKLFLTSFSSCLILALACLSSKEIPSPDPLEPELCLGVNPLS